MEMRTITVLRFNLKNPEIFDQKTRFTFYNNLYRYTELIGLKCNAAQTMRWADKTISFHRWKFIFLNMQYTFFNHVQFCFFFVRSLFSKHVFFEKYSKLKKKKFIILRKVEKVGVSLIISYVRGFLCL